MKCICHWEKRGGDVVRFPALGCPTHATPDTGHTIDSMEPQLERLAENIKGKHSHERESMASPTAGYSGKYERVDFEPTKAAGLPIMCDHAIEIPVVCHCPKNCYCRTHTCPPGKEHMFHGDHELGKQADDRHTFASGASSSGRKPNYVGAMPQFVYEAFARHREVGDEKHGEDNYMKGCNDRAFILDRINHGIEHLLKLAAQVKSGQATRVIPRGEDDAAAVMCAGMFIMVYQRAQDEKAQQDTAEWVRPGYGHGV